MSGCHLPHFATRYLDDAEWILPAKGLGVDKMSRFDDPDLKLIHGKSTADVEDTHRSFHRLSL